MTNNGPTTEKERFAILDILRGMALLGIALANFPEFGLWTFLSAQEQTAMPTGDIDRVVRFLEYVFVEGKFYSIFSLQNCNTKQHLVFHLNEQREQHSADGIKQQYVAVPNEQQMHKTDESKD